MVVRFRPAIADVRWETDLTGISFPSDLTHPGNSDLSHPDLESPATRRPPMGISSLPAPSEGVLTLLLVNTALSISLFKEIVRSLLHVVGLHRAPSDPDLDQDQDLADSPFPAFAGGESLTDRFRSRVKPVRFGVARRVGDREGHAVDCRVCLTRFEPDSVVNRLPCGHLFHKGCLERWLDYHHVTCPLCRTQLLPPPAEDASASGPWS